MSEMMFFDESVADFVEGQPKSRDAILYDGVQFYRRGREFPEGAMLMGLLMKIEEGIQELDAIMSKLSPVERAMVKGSIEELIKRAEVLVELTEEFPEGIPAKDRREALEVVATALGEERARAVEDVIEDFITPPEEQELHKLTSGILGILKREKRRK